MLVTRQPTLDKQARFWEKTESGAVKCRLCPHGCVISEGRAGLCGVRENRNGNLVTANYARITSLAIDPVEKKPLYHFEPGGFLLSIGSFGCNFACQFCQNWHISQDTPQWACMSPEEIVRAALEQRRKHPEIVGIAYTYNEPTVWLEFVLDCAEAAASAGLANVLVTNGYISEEALEAVLPYTDALNIDVKAWQQDFYRDLVRGRLEPVLKTVEKASQKAWVEVTYLVIPGKNDRPDDVRELSKWMKSISPAMPLHLSRYFPAYKLNVPPTPLKTLEALRDVALENLRYVYIGNALQKGYADTRCPECGELLLERGGLHLEASHLVNGSCPRCGRAADIVGKVWI